MAIYNGGRWKLYDTAKYKIGQAIMDLDGHTFKCALFTSASNCNTLTFDEYADLTNQVANGNGYTTTGLTLTSVTLTNTSGVIKFDCADPAWTASGSGITAKYAVIYDDTVAGDPLLCVMDLNVGGSSVTAPSGQELKITIDVRGVFIMSGATTD